MFRAINANVSMLALSVAGALTLAGCGEDTSATAGPDFGGGSTPPPVDTEFNEQALITNLADNVITPVYQQFNLNAQSQASLVDAYCQAEVALGELTGSEQAVTDTKVAAQQGWSAAMATWQQAELMLLGPLLENDSLLRNSIYSWPIVNTCAVDYDVVFFQEGTVNGQPYDITLRTPTRKGMAALEYLLFNNNLEDSCDTAPPEGWRNQTDTERKIARCAFATEVANDIVNSSNELLTRWSGDNGYANQLKTAGTATSDIPSEHDAVNRISDAMFYIDSSTKDGKLATPLGIFANTCGSQACPEDVESNFAMQSISHIANNLKAFEDLLTGKDGVGFIEYLIDVGDQDTADTMSADVEAAIADTEAYQSTLAEALLNNEAQVTETHTKVKAVTDKLKVDFINSLALELPQTSAGDND
ncbi:imelysin family protein [Thalassotalea euphylliae]|uniref:imelysin family protein n=1 Tax=Thalassotalea euphylliae TaxID=1655234 RepID=UPI00363C5963